MNEEGVEGGGMDQQNHSTTSYFCDLQRRNTRSRVKSGFNKVHKEGKNTGETGKRKTWRKNTREVKDKAKKQ